ncbi:chloramphenicol-sensitive protein RarD [Desulfotomaculum arcticum]|uniref:Chloramphenicol-sensitive protein RarD n=1 Tax=Desulfotruncus arcticus DSM 17038 TaxID=1121424 RepID=A0A1I2TMB1_9FIRM|nr:EamA family transporter RarD [Desulfotruncus arcticus]SFG66054.1 chloramphenicol-sensitive protein RarD [Desulfotomaculum arcticum] [Desulfotruncus arcticus DSM 17038]
MNTDRTNPQAVGVASAAGAYTLWGILPVYWKLIQQVPSQQILAHRFIWSFVFLLAIILFTRKTRIFLSEVHDIVHKPKELICVMLASILISVNWFTYIWAVNHNHVLETSLGYYINPLVSVMLGIIILKEKLSFWEAVSFLLAIIGVLNMTFHYGAFPWVALTLAFSFGFYGLFKKMIDIGAITGITLETLFITPIALTFVFYVQINGTGAFSFNTPIVAALLMGAGVVTAVPLILFANGAKRLPLSIVGFLQYIAPTITLFLGIFLYHEPFTSSRLTSFIFIWTALAIFSLSKTKWFSHVEPAFWKKKDSFDTLNN